VARAQEKKFDSSESALGFYHSLIANGYQSIAGLDECGRGPYAGPVVAACVLLPRDHGIVGIKDSKRLSRAKREKLAAEIMSVAVCGIGVRENTCIDDVNIRVATHLAAADAALQCMYSGASIDYLLCDGGLYLEDRVPFLTTPIIKGDKWFECISAASIVAKVYRDTQMMFYHDIWPEYGFDTNSGYGTKSHIEAIKRYGISPIHRRSFGICKSAPERINEQRL